MVTPDRSGDCIPLKEYIDPGLRILRPGVPELPVAPAGLLTPPTYMPPEIPTTI